MRRGTRVGEAYVAITADGSGINDDITKAVEEAGPGVEQAGEEHGDRYGERFSDRFRARLGAMREQVSTKLGDSLSAAGAHAGREAGDEAGKSFVDRMSDRVRDVGDRIGGELGDRMASRPEAMRRGIERTFDDDFSNRIGDRLGERIASALGDRMEMAMAALGDDLDGMLAKVSGNRKNPKGGSGSDGGRSLGSRIGGALGGGSRNNVLNLFGKSLGNMIDLVSKVTSGASKMFSLFKTGFTQASEGASFLQKVMGGLSKVGASGGEGGTLLSSLGAGAAAAGPAVIALVLALSVLVSILGALAGIITALVATITSGLVGALIVAGAGVGALVAAAGLLTSAFMAMDDAQRKSLANTFRPLREEMIGIGQIMLNDLMPAFSIWSENLQKALLLAAPVANVMGEAFAQAGASLTAAFSGPGFQMFAASLATYLPSIVNGLAVALGQFLNGLLSTFSVLMPYVSQFAGWLASIATRFADWAASAAGQNSIADFAARAVESLKSLWGFVSSFSGLVSRVLFSAPAQAAGNTMFDAFSRAFDTLKARISDGSLERWFGQAIQFGGQFWTLLQSIGHVLGSLYDAGVLDAVGTGFEALGTIFNVIGEVLGPVIDLLGRALPLAMAAAMTPIQLVAVSILSLVDGLRELGNFLSNIPGLGFLNSGDVNWSTGPLSPGGILSQMGSQYSNGFDTLVNGNSTNTLTYGETKHMPLDFNLPSFDLGALQASGAASLANTSKGSLAAGNLTQAQKDYYNKLSASLIKEGPSISATIKNALLSINKQVAKAVRDASNADSADAVKQGLSTTIQNIRTTAEQGVNSARDALNSAAQGLAGVTTQKAADKAIAKIRAAQRDLSAALANQSKINAVAAKIAAQKVVSGNNVRALLDGFKVQSATLADYAAARERVTARLEKANKKLTDAIALRDQYKAQVIDAVKSFGSLLSAQAQVIDGVTQALSFGDITKNLEDRLTKIKAFQANLQILLARGLSNDAYKQLVDAGVDQGGAYADALAQGGVGAVDQVNSLTQQINDLAAQLGADSSNRMYQAGVDTAQGLVDGLVDGLESLSGRLDKAATRLGNAIAAAVKRSLGINSPSRVMLAQMDYVGDGIEQGLDGQHSKVGSAATRLSGRIAVSPEVAAYASRQGTNPTVSGNQDQRPIEVTIVTPTSDPRAVAMETISELTGRL